MFPFISIIDGKSCVNVMTKSGRRSPQSHIYYYNYKTINYVVINSTGYLVCTRHLHNWGRYNCHLLPPLPPLATPCTYWVHIQGVAFLLVELPPLVCTYFCHATSTWWHRKLELLTPSQTEKKVFSMFCLHINTYLFFFIDSLNKI